MKRMPSAVSRLRTLVVASSTAWVSVLIGLISDARTHQVENVRQHDHQANQQHEDHDRVGDPVPHPFDDVQEAFKARLLVGVRVGQIHCIGASVSHDTFPFWSCRERQA